MAKLLKVKGVTSVILEIFIQDSSSTTGAGLTGLVFNSGSLTCYYHRNTSATATAVTLVTMTAGTFTSSGFKEVDATNMPGIYALCLPDAAYATGADSVSALLKGATNMAPIALEIQLTGVDVADGVRFGMTALPNAAAEAAGGLYTRGSGAGQINQANNGQVDANAARTGGTTNTGRDIGASVLLSTGTGTGQLDFTSGVVKANLAQILGTAITETAGQIAAAFKKFFDKASPTGTINSIPDAVAGATGGVFIAGTNAATTVTTALTTTFTGNLTGSVGSVTGAVGSVTGAVGSVTGAVGSVTGNVGGNVVGSVASLTTNNDKTGYALTTLESGNAHSGTAQAGAASTITLAAGASATDGLYVGEIVKIYGATGAGQARVITAYVGATKVATVDRAWATNPDNTSTYAVLADVVPKVDSSLQVTAASVQGNLTGSVGSVTGAVGSVTGSVGSVTGAVGSVTGAVGSVTGNVGGNVTGSVGSVATGGIAAASFAAGAIDNAAIATDAIGSAELAASAANEIADALLDRADAIETGSTPRGAMRLMLAALAGKASGLATATAVYRNAVADSKARITATVDADGNRTAITSDQT